MIPRAGPGRLFDPDIDRISGALPLHCDPPAGRSIEEKRAMRLHSAQARVGGGLLVHT
jgi:hypothetical protein